MKTRLLFAGLLLCLGTTSVASSLVQTQLRGVRSTNLVVFVSRDLPGFGAIEADVRDQAVAILKKDGGISPDSPDAAWLSVTVDSSDAPLCNGAVLIRVKVEFSEAARLTREPAIAVGRAVTWSRDWAGVGARDSLRELIRAQVDIQVGSFATDVKTAEHYQDVKK